MPGWHVDGGDEEADDIECPRCGAEIERLEIDASGEVTCPHCGHEFDRDEPD